MQLKEIMTMPVQVIGLHETLDAAERRMLHHGIHHLVVADRGRLAGLLTHDILVNRRDDGAASVEDAMIRNIVVATPEMTVREAADLMSRGHAQTALPVLRGRRLVGIVTVFDLLSLVGTTRRHGDHAASVPRARP
jgi:CBS domain-containing membrane protein